MSSYHYLAVATTRSGAKHLHSERRTTALMLLLHAKPTAEARRRCHIGSAHTATSIVLRIPSGFLKHQLLHRTNGSDDELQSAFAPSSTRSIQRIDPHLVEDPFGSAHQGTGASDVVKQRSSAAVSKESIGTERNEAPPSSTASSVEPASSFEVKELHLLW